MASNKKTWYLPEKALSHCSAFFNAPLNGNFSEATSKSVNLPEEASGAFELWATWLCLGSGDRRYLDAHYEEDCMRAWKLGDKLGCPAFKDIIMSELLNCLYVNPPNIDLIPLAYEGSLPGSKLRQLIVEWIVWYKLRHLLEGTAHADKYITILKGLPEYLEDSVKLEMDKNASKHQPPFKHKYRYYENPGFNK